MNLWIGPTRISFGVVAGCCMAISVAAAQDTPSPAGFGGAGTPRMFAGAVAGIAPLSADARTVVSPDRVAISLYKPENGPALNALVGAHVHDYVTIQMNYIWNRNDLALSSALFGDTGHTFYEQPRASSQHAAVADLFGVLPSAWQPVASLPFGWSGHRSVYESHPWERRCPGR